MTITGGDFAGWEPYVPACWPRELGNPWAIVTAEGTTAWQKWTNGLAPGELPRLVAEARAKVAAGEAKP